MSNRGKQKLSAEGLSLKKRERYNGTNKGLYQEEFASELGVNNNNLNQAEDRTFQPESERSAWN